MKKKNITVDMNAKVINMVKNPDDNGLYFIKGQFKDGTFLAFYIPPSSGTIKDQVRGWITFNLKNKHITGNCETFYWGSSDCAYKEWIITKKKSMVNLQYLEMKTVNTSGV